MKIGRSTQPGNTLIQGNSSNGLSPSSSPLGLPIMTLAIGVIGLVGLSVKFILSKRKGSCREGTSSGSNPGGALALATSHAPLTPRSSTKNCPPAEISGPLRALTSDPSFLGLSGAQLSSLRELVISGDPSNDVMDRLRHCRSLEKVTLENVSSSHLAQVLDLLPSSLKDLTLSKSHLLEGGDLELTLDGKKFPNLEKLQMEKISLSQIVCIDLTQLKLFNTTGCFLQSVVLDNCSSLRSDGWIGLRSIRGYLEALTMKSCPQITDLDLSEFSLLDCLSLEKLDSLSLLNLAVAPVYGTESISNRCGLRGLSSLKKLIIAADSGRSLSQLATLLPPTLEELEIKYVSEGQRLVEYDFKEFPPLTRLSISPFSGGDELLKAGWHLSLKNGERLQEVIFNMDKKSNCHQLQLANFPSLTSISGVNSLMRLQRFEVVSCPKLTALVLEKMLYLKSVCLTQSSATGMKSILFTGCAKLEEVLFGKFDQLEELDLSGTPLTVLDATSFPNLRILRLINSGIVNFSHFNLLARTLEDLDISGIKIRGENNGWFGLSDFEALKRFTITSSTFTELDLRRFSKLEHFSINDDGESSMKRLILRGFSSLESLTSCGLGYLSSSLEELKLVDLRIPMIALGHFTQLKSLHVQGLIARSDSASNNDSSDVLRSIRDINLNGCKSLTTLTFEGVFPDLASLNVSECPLKEVTIHQDQAPKLSFFRAYKCTELRKLYLCSGLVRTNRSSHSHVDITSCSKLSSTHLFLIGFPYLQLECRESLIDSPTAEKLMQAAPR